MSNFHKFNLGRTVERVGPNIRLKPLGRLERMALEAELA